MKKFCESLREHEMKEINFKRKKIEVINEKVAGIIKKCKHLLHSKNYKIKNMWKINNVVKLVIIVIIQGDIEVLCIAYVI